MEEIIVLDYYDGSVWIYKLPCPSMNDAEDITELVTEDEFLEKFKKWYLSD